MRNCPRGWRSRPRILKPAFPPIVSVAADPVPSDRLPFGGTWNGLVGLADVDPTTRTQFTVTVPNGGDGSGRLAAGATTTQINNAINSAASGQYIEFASGTFTFSADFTVGATGGTKNGITLRG